jgi:hypothetical protein
MTFNVSGPFFAQFGIDQLHSEGALLVQERKIPLVASLNPSADVEQTVSNLYLKEKVTVPAFSIYFSHSQIGHRRNRNLLKKGQQLSKKVKTDQT